MAEPVLISGSLALDTIMDFQGLFADYILPEQIHSLSLSFPVSSLEKTFGGTAGNVAYGMKLLQGDPVIVSALGKDGETYRNWFHEKDITTEYIADIQDVNSAAAHILTDRSHNQLSAFFEGPLLQTVSLPEGISRVCLVGPTVIPVLLRHIEEAKNQGMAIIFDPGQQTPGLSNVELITCLQVSAGMIVNDYEMKVILHKTGLEIADIIQQLEFLIITKGVLGSELYTQKSHEAVEIASVANLHVVDPTGAGDAFRAGFLVGYSRGMELAICLQLGSVLASYCIESAGTQSYHYELPDFSQRYQTTYNQPLPLN